MLSAKLMVRTLPHGRPDQRRAVDRPRRRANPQAKQKQVYILHEGVSQKIPVNYKKSHARQATEQNAELMPGGTVVVP